MTQAIKNLRLKTVQKFKEEINFTDAKHTAYQKKLKEIQMGDLEPALTIAKK